ncbi:forkhead box protein M1 [Zootoca vivipara]|uniref:forkhead box protein M1 n=1 Tax=Zootoca vivipara TaxID=8524 RepID=UPI00293BFAD1|nr:forkhead box protein M1 [Zootoca vivipara]XP_060135003.1 forkhead box protein M1 [Zootoca vivipara]
MKSSPHRPLILKRRKLSFPHSDAASTLAGDEPSGQNVGSPKQEEAKPKEHGTNKTEPGNREAPVGGIKIIDHPTLSDAQVVAIPANTDVQSIIDALTARGKESGSNGPSKFILIRSSSPRMERREFNNLFKPDEEHSTAHNKAEEDEKYIGQSSALMEELLSMDGREQEENSSAETTSSVLDNSLTNIQWLGNMSSSGLSPCSVKKETEKENQTPKQKAIKAEEGSAASSSTTSWQESFSERPPYSYMAMIQFAINSTEKKRMMLKDIYTWIEDHFPYFKHVAKPGWKNSIRHNLSLHDMFVRETSANGKISFWTIHPEANRYLTLDQVFKPLDVQSPASPGLLESQQKRHIPDLQKNMRGTSGRKNEPQTARRKMKPLLPRVNSYLVPIQFPLSQSVILQPSSKMPLPAAQGASETMQSSKPVCIAPKGLPSNEEPALLPAPIPIKEETCDGELSPFTSQQSIKQDACWISKESFTAALHIKEESDNFHSNTWAPQFLPTVSTKVEPVQLGEQPDIVLPAPPAKQKRPFTALKSPSRSKLDTLVIKRQERQEVGRSRRKQHLALPSSEEPVLLLLQPTSRSESCDPPFETDTHLLENTSQFSCSQGEVNPFKSVIKEMFCKMPISSVPSKAPITTPAPFLTTADPWRLAPFVKETSDLLCSPVRTPPTSLISLQGNVDILGLGSTPLRPSLCDSPQLPLLNAETNDMVSGPLTSSPASSKQSSPELQSSALPENHSFLEGLVLDTMNDSLSKILLDVSFPGLEDDNLGTDLSWSQLIPELK